MRRWLLLIMILLLPLRGWVGEAMAGEMLQQQVALQQGHHESASAGAAHDCEHQHEHGMQAEQDAQAQPPAGDHCPTCAACQVCSSVALSPALRAVPASGFHHPPPMHVQRAFSSAEPVLAFKPPRT